MKAAENPRRGSVLTSGLGPVSVAVMAVSSALVASVLRRIDVVPRVPVVASELLISSNHSLVW